MSYRTIEEVLEWIDEQKEIMEREGEEAAFHTLEEVRKYITKENERKHIRDIYAEDELWSGSFEEWIDCHGEELAEGWMKV